MDEINKLRELAEQQQAGEPVALTAQQLESFYAQAAQLVASQCIAILESVRDDPAALDRAVWLIRERFGG
jgi:hypothetical protein